MSVACHDRSRRWQEIQNGLQFIQSTLPFPGSQEQYEVFIQDLVRNLFGEGNDVFQEGEWTKSIEMYTEALSIAEYAESEEIVIPIGLLEKLYANRAAAYLNMVPGLHDQALEDCEKALHYNEGNYRALYRKAKSLKELGRHQEAYESVAKCSLVVPQDPNVMQLTLDLAKLLGLKIRKAYVRNKPALNVLRGSSYSGTSCEKFSHGCTSVEEIETEMSPLSPEARAPTPVSAPPPLYQPMNGNNNGRAEETLMTPWEEPSMSPVCNNHLPSSASHSSASHSSASHSPTEMMCGFEPAASPVPVASVMSSSIPGSSMSSSSLPHHHGPSLVNGGTRASQPSYMLPESRQDYEVDIMGDDLDDLLDLAGPPEPSMAIPTVKGSIHLPTSIASGGSMPSSPFLMPSPINPFLHHVPQRQQCTVNLPPLYNKPGSGSSSGYSLGLEGLDSFAAPIDSLDSLSMNDSHHTDYGGGHHSFTISQMNNNDKPMGMAVGMPDTKGHASHVDLAKNPLAETHEFKQACSLCFIKTGPAVLDYTLRTEEHKCKKDWLLSRIKHVADKTWKLIRTRPTKNQYVGPYYVCKEVSIGQECVYPGHCTFAYCQEEIDVWTLERKGFISREALFDPFGSHCNLRMSVPKILQEHHGIFMFLCEVCFDHRPRIISKANKENPSLCSHPVTKHDFEDHKCLVHILKENTVRYSKVRPLNPLCQLDLCRHEVRYGCVREDDCFYAHSLIELKVWGMQHELGITHESIVQEARKYWCIETSLQGAQQYPPVQKKFGPPNLKLQFVCGQCWRNGQLSEADKNKKYCTAKARHTWSKDRRVVLVSSTERKKWTTVRQLPSKKPIPSQFEICMHVTAGKKCQYIGNCTFAHSGEEKDLWTYMKENNIPDLDQLYEHWLQSQKPGWGEETPPPPNNAVRENGRQIVMPTDYAEEVAGNHCWLCGKNSNGEKQWQQHITSEKHKDKVFNSEDDQNCWQYRFPTGTFRVCERFLQDTCTEEELCKLAHGNQELKEWIERREFLLMKLAKARKDHLIAPNDNDFGKYSFLLKDIN